MPSLKHYLLYLLLTLPFCALLGQNPGLEALKNDRFDEARSVFENQLEEKKLRIAGAYGMALLFADKDYDQYNIYQANEYISLAKAEMRDARDRTKDRLKEIDVSSRDISKSYRAIQEQAVAEAREQNTQAAYNTLLEKVKLRYSDRRGIEMKRDSLAVEEARSANTYEAYTELLDQYGKAMRRTNRDLYDAVERLQFETFIQQNGFAQYDTFAQAHPRHIYVTDSGSDAFIKIYDSKKLNDFELFLNQYQSSLYLPFAKAKIDELKIAEQIKSIRIAKGKFNVQHERLVKLIKPHIDAKDWEAAIKQTKEVEKYCRKNPYYHNLIELLEAPEQGVVVKSLGSGPNSKGNEYSPALSGDELSLYFCGQGRGDNIGGEDIFESKWDGTKWSRARVVKTISTPFENEAPQSISSDGNNIIMFSGGKLAISNKTSNGWAEPEKMPYKINFAAWQSDGFVTADGQHFIYVSGQNASNEDIFIAHKKEDGSWDTPINIGDQINTPYAERDPFLHPDMRTLYFSSIGHGGLGDLDVFVTTRLDDTWTNWSTPKNLGKELNSSGTDWGYKITIDGKKAIFSAVFLEFGESQDLYEASLPEELRPQSVKTVSGVVKGLNPNESAKVIVRNKPSGELIGELYTEPGSGKYFLTVPNDAVPVVTIEKQGLISAPQELDVSASNNVQDIEVTDLNSMKKGDEVAVAFNDLLFDTDQAIIKKGFQKDLDNIAQTIKEKNLQVRISGHTDSEGEADYNLDLSERRAQAVRDYLISKGVPANVITAKGFGESQPVADNDTESGKAQNRRVEMTFTKK